MTPRCGSASASGASDSSAGSHTPLGRNCLLENAFPGKHQLSLGKFTGEKVSFWGGYDIPVVSVSLPHQLLSCINIKRRKIFCKPFKIKSAAAGLTTYRWI